MKLRKKVGRNPHFMQFFPQKLHDLDKKIIHGNNDGRDFYIICAIWLTTFGYGQMVFSVLSVVTANLRILFFLTSAGQ
jgi:hypothetical protein